MICPACGTDNIAGTDQCAECGGDLRDLDLPAAHTPMEQSVMEDPIGGLVPADPLMVSPATPIREVIQQLVETGRHCALVVNSHQTMVGIFTERDILLRVAHRYHLLADHPVSEFMTVKPERVRPTDTIAFGLNRMMLGDYRHLPVEEDGRALGVVSIRDILGYLVHRHPDILSVPA